MAPDLIGKQLGSYKVISLIGEGGMGAVYLGEHEKIGRKAAIKVLHPQHAAQPEIVQRFFNEARAANLASHQAIVDIYDFGESPEAGAYLVMEYLEGESLADRIARRGELDLRAVVRIVERVGAALQATHAKDIVHRDLKPANIFLVPDAFHPDEEQVKVLDFGIAKLAAEAGGPATKSGIVLGTPAYMSPEQCDGAKHVDHRTDIYALSVIAYEALCGQPPFDAPGSGRLMAMQMYDSPPPLRERRPDLPEALEAALLQGLAKEPAERFAAVAGLVSAFKDAAGVDDASIPPTLVDPISQQATEEDAAKPAIGYAVTEMAGDQPAASDRPASASAVAPTEVAAAAPPAVIAPSAPSPEPLDAPSPVAPSASSSDSGGLGVPAKLAIAGVGLLVLVGVAVWKLAQDPPGYALNKIDSALDARAWEKAILLCGGLEEQVKPQATERCARAAREKKARELYTEAAAAAGKKQHKRALQLFGKIPAESVYHADALASDAYKGAARAYREQALITIGTLLEVRDCEKAKAAASDPLLPASTEILALKARAAACEARQQAARQIGKRPASGVGPNAGASSGGRGGRVASAIRKKPARIIAGRAEVRGSLSKEAIRRIIRHHINVVKHCYQRGLAKNPQLYGRLIVRFTVAATGQVVVSKVQSSTLKDRTVETCIATAVRRWLFPKPKGGGIAIISYPFVLRSVGPVRAGSGSPAIPPPAEHPQQAVIPSVPNASKPPPNRSSVDPTGERALVAAALNAYASKRYREAFRLAGKVIKLHPLSAWRACPIRGTAACQLKKVAAARRAYARCKLQNRRKIASVCRSKGIELLAGGRRVIRKKRRNVRKQRRRKRRSGASSAAGE